MSTVARLFAVVFVSVVLLIGCSGKSEFGTGSELPSNREGLDRERVAEAIGRSSEDWLAAVQEVVDDSQCYGPKDGTSCRVLVRVVDFIDGSVERPAGWEYWNVEMQMPDAWPNRSIGRRRLVISGPMGDATDVHGNLVFVVDPSSEDAEHLQTLIEEVREAV